LYILETARSLPKRVWTVLVRVTVSLLCPYFVLLETNFYIFTTSISALQLSKLYDGCLSTNNQKTKISNPTTLPLKHITTQADAYKTLENLTIRLLNMEQWDYQGNLPFHRACEAQSLRDWLKLEILRLLGCSTNRNQYPTFEKTILCHPETPMAQSYHLYIRFHDTRRIRVLKRSSS
jgi:hypothetical protein